MPIHLPPISTIKLAPAYLAGTALESDSAVPLSDFEGGPVSVKLPGVQKAGCRLHVRQPKEP